MKLLARLINRFEMIPTLCVYVCVWNVIRILNKTRCENFCKARNRIHRVN